MLEEVYGLLNRNAEMDKLFKFDDEELSVIAEKGDEKFLEMNRTWLNDEGGDLSFLKEPKSD
jgi:hypothetical protein